MTDNERDGLIERAMQKLGNLDRMLQCLADGGRAFMGNSDMIGDFKDGEIYVAENPNSSLVPKSAWLLPLEAIRALSKERLETEIRLAEVETQLRDMGMGDYVKGANQ